jgi:hypothetical protein
MQRSLAAIVVAFSLMLHTALDAAERKEFRIDQPIRLHSWMLSPEAASRLPYDAALNWISTSEERAQKKRIEQLIETLSERSLLASGDPFGAARLKALVEGLPYRGRVALPSTDPRWLEVNSASDPVLQPGDRIISFRRPTTVALIFSNGSSCSLPHRSGQPAKAYVISCLRSQGHLDETAFARDLQDITLWIAQPDGQVFNAFMDSVKDLISPEPAPGAWIWVPQGWAKNDDEFSQSFTQLLAAQGPAGNYLRVQSSPDLQTVSRRKSFPVTRSQYGSIGLIQMPSARMSPEGTLSVSRTMSDPYRRINIQVQALPWLEYGLRYTNIRNRLYGPESFSGDQTYVDKSLDLKIRLLEETDRWPQISVGMIDAVGTGLFSSEYIVATKRFGNFDVSGGLAFGVLGAARDFGNPIGLLARRFKTRQETDREQGGIPLASTWFTGPASPFLGVQWATPWPKWVAKLEYSANDGSLEPYLGGTIRAVRAPISPINAGLVYQWSDWVDLSFGVERGYQLFAGINLYTSLNRQPISKILDRPAPSILPIGAQQSNIAVNRPSSTPGQTDAQKWKTISKEIERTSLWPVERIEQNDTQLIIRFLSTPGVYAGDRIELVSRLLHQHASETITEFVIQLAVSGLEVTEVVIDRERFVRERTELVPPIDRKASPALREQDPSGASERAGQVLHDSLERARLGDFAWGNISGRIGANYTHLLGGPTGFWLFQLGLGARLEWRPHPSTWLDASVNLRLIDNYNNFYNNPAGRLPPVRTFIRDYLDTENPLTVPNAQLTHIGALSGIGPGHFYSVYGGWLEWMFGGVGAEYLYRPWGSRLAFGLDVNWVQQRDFAQRFTFREYSTTTGHATAYWDTGWNGVLVKAKAGQYLARDRGVTLDVSRTLPSGATIGALATKTNVSAADFGEGSFDKVLYIKVPFDLMLPKRSNFDGLFIWRNLTSNAGAILGRRHALYDLTEKRDPRALRYGAH